MREKLGCDMPPNVSDGRVAPQPPSPICGNPPATSRCVRTSGRSSDHLCGRNEGGAGGSAVSVDDMSGSSESPLMTEQAPPAPRGPARADERALAPDLARGLMLLMIVLANTPWYLYGSTPGLTTVHPDEGSVLDRVDPAADHHLRRLAGVPDVRVPVRLRDGAAVLPSGRSGHPGEDRPPPAAEAQRMAAGLRLRARRPALVRRRARRVRVGRSGPGGVVLQAQGPDAADLGDRVGRLSGDEHGVRADGGAVRGPSTDGRERLQLLRQLDGAVRDRELPGVGREPADVLAVAGPRPGPAGPGRPHR